MALFRPAVHLSENLRTLAALAGAGSGAASLPFDREFAVILGVALFFTFFAALPRAAALQRLVFDADPSLPRQLALVPAAGLLLLLCLSMVAWSPFSPFVYFRF
jgi:hypothetical protein